MAAVSNYDQIASIPDSAPPAVDTTTSAGTESTPTGTDTPVETQPETQTESQPEQVTSEQSADATATEPQVEENPYAVETDTEGEAPKQTLDVILKSPRGREIYQNHKIITELAKPIEQGGIGHVPTVAQMRDYHAAYRDRVVMDHHLNSGDPKGAQTFIQFAMGQNRGQAAEILAANIAPTLASSNPDAYVAASMPFMTNYETALWDRWKTTPAGPDKEDLWRTAQMVHRDLTGNWMSEGDLGVAPQGGNQPDPLAGERQQLEEQRQQIQQERQQNVTAFNQRWDNGIATSTTNSLLSEVDKALAPLKSMHSKAPRMYEAARKDYYDSIVRAVQSNKHAWDMFQVKISQARRLGTPQAAQQVVGEYMQMAIPAIKASFRQFLRETGAVMTNISDARHAQLSSIDSKRDVGGNGTNPTPGKGAPVTRRPGESASDFNFRQLNS
ncbi:MAG TPA: hypothetical protein VNZ86_13640 [Bacteroidia bacterium]|nr:hypothetical protein [Bacteroidia bacterium]